MKKTILLTALGICCMVAATSRTKAAEKVSGKYHYEIINSTQKTAALTTVEQPGTQVILPSSIDGYTIVQLGTMKENNYHFASASTLRLEGKAELFSAADSEKVDYQMPHAGQARDYRHGDARKHDSQRAPHPR